MRLTKLAPALIIFVASTASADVFGCSSSAQRRASLPSATVLEIVVIGRVVI